MQRPRNIAHRGARLLAVENTIEAIRIAFDQGAEGVEFDVQVTLDGEPVLFHDDALKTFTGVQGTVQQWSWSELRRLPLHDAHGHRGRIAHLAEVLEELSPLHGLFNLELKVVNGSSQALVKAVSRYLHQIDPSNWLISSFCHRALQTATDQLDSFAQAALIDNDVDCDYWHLIESTEARQRYSAVHPHGALLPRLAGSEVAINVWTLNEPEHWQIACNLEVAGIITDDPASLAGFLSTA